MKLETIQESIKTAMKTHATLEVETLRSVVAAVKKAAIDKRMKDNITEELVDEVLRKEQKTLKEMIDTCPATRPELLDEYNLKLNILSEYVPQLITDSAIIEKSIKDIVNNEIEFIKANRGKIMKLIAPALKGVADMSIVNKVIGEMLV